MRLEKLIENIHYIKKIGDDKEILSLSTDSRTCGDNSLFICLKGTHADAHKYAEEAIRRGAVGLVVEREISIKADIAQIVVKDTREAVGLLASAFYLLPSRALKIVGITGTNGKTTTSYMLASILEKAGKEWALSVHWG